MCGIAGFSSTKPVPADAISRTLTRMQHRGPDGEGYLAAAPDGTLTRGKRPTPETTLEGTVLLHRHLSILDLSDRGAQPMSTPDDRYHIILNGEVYNYLELRDELEAEGITFTSGTDTEVILEAYAHWGPECFPRFTGMYALAILDNHERRLTLARDPYGIKPLLYVQREDLLAFASDLPTLLEIPGAPRQANARVARQFLTGQRDDRIDAYDTFVDGARKLPPGAYLEIDLDNLSAARPTTYYQLHTDATFEGSHEDAFQHLRQRIEKSVELHLRSDVPVAVSLSGGLDSTIVACAIRQAIGPDREFHAFGYMADDPALDETHWIELVAKAANMTLHPVRPSQTEAADDLERFLAIVGEPVPTASMLAQFKVFEAVHAAGIKVVLTGQGVDEMMGGYTHHIAARATALAQGGHPIKAIRFLRATRTLPGIGPRGVLKHAAPFFLPARLTAWLRRRARIPGHEPPTWLNPAWTRSLGSIALHRPHRGQEALRGTLRDAFEATSLPMNLNFDDRTSMAHSVEARVPFLVPDIVDFVFSLPDHLLVDDDATTKRVLRGAAEGLIPEEVRNRRDKIGFAATDHAWLLDAAPWVDALLADMQETANPCFDMEALQTHWQAVQSGQQPYTAALWRSIIYLAWVRNLGIQLQPTT